MARLVLSVLMLSAPAGAHAQREMEAVRLVEGLARCRVVDGDAARLACFERLADRARRSDEVVVIDRDRMAERKRERFGLRDEGGTLVVDAGEAAPEVREIESTIRGVVPARDHGRWNMELANGTVWQTIDPTSFGPRVGAPVKVRTASLGGYRASMNGRSFLVKRLR